MRPVIGYNYGAGEHKRVKKSTTSHSVWWCDHADRNHHLPDCSGTAHGDVYHKSIHNPGRQNSTPNHLCRFSGFLCIRHSLWCTGGGWEKGTASLVVSLCRYLLLILPAAFILCRIFGAVGVWHAFWIAEALTAGISFLISKRASVFENKYRCFLYSLYP